jgi:hypothetical protein
VTACRRSLKASQTEPVALCAVCRPDLIALRQMRPPAPRVAEDPGDGVVLSPMTDGGGPLEHRSQSRHTRRVTANIARQWVVGSG